MKNIIKIVILVMTIILPNYGFAVNFTDYLILQDIGPYIFMAKGGGGQGAGLLAPTGHFNKDHIDESFGGIYFYDANEVGVNVEVTKHAGSDSDKWLLHEVDMGSRDAFGIPAMTYAPRQIDGQTILVNSVGGRKYRWVSGGKVIFIEYHGSLRTLPEPLEVVQAYLAKHPSTVPTMTLVQLRSTEYKTKWIKDEMDRRLWLCDKWFMQLQLKKAEEKQVYQETVRSMVVFLNYREKYYGINALNEKNLISSYAAQNNGTGIKAKLTEYKNWWSVNKEKAISL